MKRMILTAAVLLLAASTLNAAFTYSIDNFRWNSNKDFQRNGNFYLWADGVEDRLEGTTAIDFLKLTSTNTEPGTTEGMIYYDTSEHTLKQRTDAAWVALGAGTFAGGSVTDNITMATTKVIRSTTTTANTTALQGYDVDGAAYVNAISVTNGNTMAVAIGAATASLAIDSTGLDLTTAGAVSGVTTLSASGNVTAAGVTFGSTGTSQYVAVVDIADADIDAIRGTPKQLIAAPGANSYIEVVGCELIFDYGTGTAYTESVDNLIIGYDNATTQIGATIETTGFIDQTADTAISWVPSATARATTLLVNKNVALKNAGDGEYGGGSGNDSAIRAIVTYRVHTSLSL